MRGIPLFVAVAATFAMGEVRAEADSLSGTYGKELTEVSHRVRVARSGRLGQFTVVRTIGNASRRVDELTLDIKLPTAAVATGLRVRHGKRWHTGVLMAAKRAGGLYEKLTEKGPVRSRGPALLEWTDTGALQLRAFPVAAQGSITVQYTLTAPLCYYNGWQLTAYPYDGDAKVKPRVVARGARIVSARAIRALLGADIEEACSGIGTMVSGDVDVHYIAYRTKRTAPITVRYGRHRAGAKSLARIEIDAPLQFAAKPRNARVVFVVDASISQGASGLTAQLDQIRGYLRHLPDSTVEIVLYRRYAERLFGRFVPAAKVAGALVRARSRLKLGNGSHLERGLGLASMLIAGSGPARVIAFTDSLYRDAFAAAMAGGALARLPRGGIAHLVDVSGSSGAYELQRDDSHSLRPVIERTGGMVVTLNGSTGGVSAARTAMHELVQPIRIHGFSLSGKGIDKQIQPGATLDLGVGFRAFVLADETPAQLVVKGKIWGRSIHRVIKPDAQASAQIPALVFGHELGGKLAKPVMVALATAARVVSPVTSFLARDPRVKSSSFDYDDILGSISATCGCIGARMGYTSSCGGVYGPRGIGTGIHTSLPEPEEVLRGLLRARVNGCVMSHGVSAFSIRIGVETTGTEIVDVAVSGSSDKKFAACVTDAAWELRLPALFSGKKRHATTMTRLR